MPAASQPNPAETLGVAVSGTMAYVGIDRQLVIVDVSDPANPIERGRVGLDDIVRDVTVSDDHVAYVSIGAQGMVIVDASHPARPEVFGHVKIPELSVGRTTIEGDDAYLAAGSSERGELEKVRVSDPSAPERVAELTTSTAVNDVEVDDALAYMGMGSTGFGVARVGSGPGDLELLGTVSLGESATGDGVAIAGVFAFVAAGVGGLQIIDVSAPATPRVVGSLSIDGFSGAVALADDIAYVAADPGLVIVDVSDPTKPRKLAQLTEPGCGWNLDLDADRDLVYLAAQTNGLLIVSVADPEVPKVLGHFGPSTTAMCGTEAELD
jgi:hypothetical protein